MGALIFLLLLCFVSSSAEAQQQQAASDVQGEWMSGGVFDYAGRTFGMSIGSCDDHGRCQVKTFVGSSSGMACLRRGVTAPAETPGQFDAVISPAYPQFETPCALRLSKQGERLVSQRADQGENTCMMRGCEPLDANEKRSFERLSRESFLGLPGENDGECYTMSSKSVRMLCTDKALHEMLASVKAIPLVATNRSWFVDSQIFAKCDASDTTRECLDEAYRAKIAKLKEESAKLWESYGESGDPARAKEQLAKMAGVYKRRFKNADISGKAYDSEDVFEFVPVGASAAYLKMHLEFFNGHVCDIAGVAEYKKVGGFVFQDDDDPQEPCLLTVRLTGDAIDFADPTGSCRKFCGARGGFSQGFELSRRRTIRYMPIILKSDEYIKAMEAYEKRRPQQN